VTQRFLASWDVHHRLSSAYHPHSKQRAELGVKVAKRMIRDNTAQSGSLDNDMFARALLNYRNTPCRDLKLSPAEIIYGRPIRDHLPNLPLHYKPRAEWTLTRERRELALAQRYARQEKLLNEHTKELPSLKQGDLVSLQNQHGPRAKKWDKTGLVVETLPHQQYRVRVHGSGRITLRNRQYLRKISPIQSTFSTPITTVPITPLLPTSQTQAAQPQLEQPEQTTVELGDSPSSSPSSSSIAPATQAPSAPTATSPSPHIQPQTLPLTIPFQEEAVQNEEPSLRRSARPAKPNRKFRDYIMN
jgi:hypothetical protein